jgi:hypothetical protein
VTDTHKPRIAAGYLKHDEWAKKVSQEFEDSIDKALQMGDGGLAAYFLLRKQEHEEQVRVDKQNYRGL